MKNNKRQICVIGLGQFGSELARTAAENCEVLALDRDQKRVSAIADDVDRALIADARDVTVIHSIVPSHVDAAVVSLGQSVESSILCTLHLSKLKIKKIYAKASGEDHAEVLKAVGATDVIFPERETARRVAARLSNPSILDFIPLAEDYELMEIMAPQSFHGKSIVDLDIRKKYGALIVAIIRKDPRAFIFVPEPDFLIQSDDALVVIGKKNEVNVISQA